MKNALAEQGRAALEGHYFSHARELLSSALKQHPRDVEILCEYLYCEAYFGNEDLASKRFTETKTATRHHDLQLLLSRYFYSRQQLARKLGRSDVQADDWLNANPYQPEKGVGVRLSACLITKNEEKVLAKCLDSLKGIVDEIVVVDTGSTDKTVEIAKSYGATIGNFKWVDDFSAARNEALRLATSEWALWIDADEQLDPSCKEAFQLGMLRPHMGGYSVKIINYMDDGGTTSEFVHNPTRLFRNIEGVTFTEPIHEQITPSLMKLGLPWTPLDNAVIHHDGYRDAALVEKNKVERTRTMLEAHVAKNPNEPFQIFNLANTYFVGKEFDKAAETARRAIMLMDPAGVEYGHAAYQVLVTSLDVVGRHEEALQACDECNRSAYSGIVNDYLRANTLMNLGRFDEAMVAVDRCLQLEWPKDIIGDKGIADFRRHALKGQIFSCLNKWEESLEWFEIALQRQPGFPPAMLGHAIAQENVGNLELAKAEYNALLHHEGIRVHCERGLATIYERQNNFEAAAEHFEKAWRLDTKNTQLWECWTSVLEKCADTNRVLTAYHEFAKDNVPSVAYHTNLARIYEGQNNLDLALTHFRSAIELEPENANSWFIFGDLLYRVGAYSEAMNIYESGLRLKMDHADGWFVLGNCLAQMNHDAQAVGCYQQALIHDPSHAKAIANMETVLGSVAA